MGLECTKHTLKSFSFWGPWAGPKPQALIIGARLQRSAESIFPFPFPFRTPLPELLRTGLYCAVQFKMWCRRQQVTVRAHIRLKARFRPVSPTIHRCAFLSKWNKKTFLTLDYQKFTPFCLEVTSNDNPPLLQTRYMATSNILDPPFSENLDPPLRYIGRL